MFTRQELEMVKSVFLFIRVIYTTAKMQAEQAFEFLRVHTDTTSALVFTKQRHQLEIQFSHANKAKLQLE